MQEPHRRDHHHPARVALALAAVLAALVASPANAARFLPLPSPAAQLSPDPPLGNGATSSAESVHHRVGSRISVDVSIDGSGAPFAVTATQRLDVRDTGDYFFTIGAPVLGARAAPGSASRPGFRTGAIVWAGFNPGRRILAARARLDAASAAPSLPLRVIPGHGTTLLENTTRVSTAADTANALRPQLLSYLHRLAAAVAQGRTPLSGSAEVTSTPVPVRVSVVVPLRVTGTIGGRHVSLLLSGRTVVPATGSVDLRVEPVLHLGFGDLSRLDGRALLALATRASLAVARTRQYQAFLGNPDQAGPSATRYRYRTTARRRAAPAAAAPAAGRGWVTPLLVAVGLAAALLVAGYAWARS